MAPSAAAGDAPLSITVAGGVATLRLCAAGRRNPLSAVVLRGMRDFLRPLLRPRRAGAGDGDVRVVVVASTGNVFCSGHDYADLRHGGEVARYEALLALCSEVNMLLRDIPQPSIAAVQGLATAGGCQLACSCDLVFASDRAAFCLPGVRNRFFCHTPAVALASRIPPNRALEMILRADNIPAAEAAAHYGFVNRVYPHDRLEAEVSALAAQLARRSSEELAIGKRTFYQQAAQPTLKESYRAAEPVMAQMMATERHQEAVERFFANMDRKRAAKL